MVSNNICLTSRLMMSRTVLHSQTQNKILMCSYKESWHSVA